MEWLVRLIAPRNRFDLLLKIIIFVVLLGAINFLRDTLEHPDSFDSFNNNLVEATFVSFPFVVLALMMIGHLDKLQKRLAQMALTDGLTNIPNRRAFLADCATLIEKGPGMLIMLDADHFKRVNDTYGHGTGDRVLIAIADLLRSAVADHDLVARLGGEEFAAFMPNARVNDVLNWGERLAQGVTFEAGQDDGTRRVTLSLGAAEAEPGVEISCLLAAADRALYRAKSEGRARIVVETSPTRAPDASRPARSGTAVSTQIRTA